MSRELPAAITTRVLDGRSLATRGVWLGLVLFALRLGLLAVMEAVAHDVELARVALRVSSVLPGAMAVALATGLLGAALAGLAARSSTARGPARLAAALAMAAVTTLYLTGRLSGDASRLVGLGTARGVAATAAVAASAAGFSAWLGLCAGRSGRASAGRTWRGLLVPLVLVLVLPVAGRLALGGLSERMVVREVVADLLAGEPIWKVVAGHPDRSPGVGVISPSLDFAVEGSDMPALILPPPAEVRFTVPPAEGVLRLRARAGVDHRVLRRHGGAEVLTTVRLQITIDDRLVFSQDVPLRTDGERPGSTWAVAGGDDGLVVSAGDVVTLSTRWLGPDGVETKPPAPITAGFGGLRLERRVERPRTLSSPDLPNVVLLVMDTQRLDRLSAYGYGRPTSPQVERLAARGTLFEDAYATASWTWPSTASLLTGLLPEEHGVLDNTECWLADALETLPERMQKAGVTTAAWSANVLIVPDKNFDQGFETFDHPRGVMLRSTSFMPAVLEWLDAVAGTRFFLYLQLVDPHGPLIPLPEGREAFAGDVPPDFPPTSLYRYAAKLVTGEGHSATGEVQTNRCVSPEHQRWLGDLYDAATWSGDAWLGRILDRLEALGLDDETIVVFTSDHGEELFDHGMAGHGHSVFGELTRVPLVLAGPGIPHGVRIDTPISNRHLAPTLASAAGLLPLDVPDAIDLIEAATTAKLPRQPVLFSTRQGWWNGRRRIPIWGLRSQDLVLHYAPEGGRWGSDAPTPGGESLLFDLASDADERRDLSGERPDVAKAMKANLLEWIRELESRRRTVAVPAGDATIERLRQLGYLGPGDD